MDDLKRKINWLNSLKQKGKGKRRRMKGGRRRRIKGKGILPIKYNKIKGRGILPIKYRK